MPAQIMAVFLLGSIITLLWFYISLPKKVNGKVDSFSPLVFVAAFMILMYVVKPIYILLNDWYGPGYSDSVRFALKSSSIFYFNLSLSIVLIGSISFLIGHYLPTPWKAKGQTTNCTVRTSTFRFGVPIVIILFATLIHYLLSLSGGIQNLFFLIQTRHSFFKDQEYLVLFLGIPNLIFLAFFSAYLVTKNGLPSVIILGAFAILCAILTGERSTLLFGTMIPMAIVYNYTKRRINISKAFIGLLIIILIFVSIRVLSRDINLAENKDSNQVTLLIDTLSDLPDYILGGLEVGMFDSLIAITEGVHQGKGYLGGDSIARTLFVLPKAITGPKPDRGNIAFTKNYYPDFYNVGGAGITVSYIGDWFMNFSVIGVVIGMAALGWIGRLLVVLKNVAGTKYIALYSVALTQMVLVLRSDVQQMQTMIINIILMVVVSALLFKNNTKSNLQR